MQEKHKKSYIKPKKFNLVFIVNILEKKYKTTIKWQGIQKIIHSEAGIGIVPLICDFMCVFRLPG